MKIESLKKAVNAKFGSMTKFAELIGVDRYELQKLFAAANKKMTPERQERIDQLGKLVKETKNTPAKSELTPAIRTKIEEAIKEKFGSVSAFCEENKEFSQFSVWQIMNGRRKTISASVKKLLEKLEILNND